MIRRSLIMVGLRSLFAGLLPLGGFVFEAMAQPAVSLVPFTTVDKPVDIAHAGDGRLFVVDQDGEIRVVQSDGSVEPVPFLDIRSRVKSGGERGLLGLAFHPDYASNGTFFVNYTRDPNPLVSGEAGEGDTQISRFSRIGGFASNVADPASELPILEIAQPFSNHNAGDLAFGPDGYLWIAMGDGGAGGDPINAGQNPSTLLGKMLRIDVDGGSPYAIPTDNPFVGAGPPLDEIWAFGLRNPFRFSFDRLTGDLWIADVGQGAWEEVDFEPAGTLGGRNYGWRCYEGPAPYNTTGCGPISNYTFPIHAYNHGGGRCSITGGFVYRGASFAALLGGHYFFADFCSGDLYSLTPSGCPGEFTLQTHGSLLSSPSTFGEGANGELYVASLGGTIYRIQATGTPLGTPPCLACPASPEPSCRQSGAAASSLILKNDGNDAKDRLVWKWLKGDVTPKQAYGDPLPAPYVLCTYSGSSVFEAQIPGAASCPSCWKETPSGFKFRSTGSEIQTLILKAGVLPGKAKIIARGKGASLPGDLPAVPISQPVTVQLLNADGECWEASYSAPASRNEDGLFRDKSD